MNLLRVPLMAITVLSALTGCLLLHLTLAQQGLPRLNIGTSLSVEDQDFLVSPNGSFSSGFYRVGDNAYCFAIWFTNSANKTVVWMANRDTPVDEKGSKLSLLQNGNLVLINVDGTISWETSTNPSAAAMAELLETGNLVLRNQSGVIIWESFDSPTDTLLPSQKFTKDNTLVSMRAENSFSSGYYNLHFGDNNVLNLIYNSPDITSVYWPDPDPSQSVFDEGRTPYNSTRMAFFDDMGRFESSDNLVFDAADFGFGPKRRLTLDYDGMLRMYSLDKSTGFWDVSWAPRLESCRVNGLCGNNGVCSYTPWPICTCPSGFDMTDPTDWSKGCSPSFNLTCDPLQTNFLEIENTDFYGNDLATYAANLDLETCKNVCLHDCECKGFGYALNGLGQCFPKRYLLNGYHTPDSPSIMHIKVSNPVRESMTLNPYNLNCSATKPVLGKELTEQIKKNSSYKLLIAFVIAAGVVEMICIGLGWWYIYRKHGLSEVVDMGYLALAIGFKRFTFQELKKATKNFSEELGKGGFGTVYKGSLENHGAVAVKRLEGVCQGEAEFWAEVSTIGRINHKNLVKMWGFCAEREHRLLVYEYMENGSLAKNLFSTTNTILNWDKRFEIAVGTAKGLAYLHEECLEWVLHCDVKPQNILLDGDFNPKVGDFGMSKLVEVESSDFRFSRVRGTRGYLAPEWMMNLQITAKADVYSYGVVLLELVSGKCGMNFESVEGEERENGQLVKWVVERVRGRGVEGVVDGRLNGEWDLEKVERVVRVGLMCVREEVEKRPAMSEVVELLLGDDGVRFSSRNC